ncbi:MAG: response regulator transcription factor [Acidobacteriota bacterium]|nr:response regulator transcription factor [Acidobacteriota bacterium]
MSEKIRVLIADDHPLLVSGMKMTISEWDEFEVVGVAFDGIETVNLCRELSPHLVILDMRMPRLSGAGAIARIKKDLPDVRILALTTFDDEETVQEAMRAGCDGFLLKVIDEERLRASMLSIVNGIGVFDEDVMRRVQHGMRSTAGVEFSDREREILFFVCQGLTNVEIARELSLRPGTVKNLISLLLSKTNCVSRAQLVRYAMEHQLAD